MKILFLDFDGVLNTPEYIERHGDSEAGIDRTRLALIKKLVDVLQFICNCKMNVFQVGVNPPGLVFCSVIL